MFILDTLWGVPIVLLVLALLLTGCGGGVGTVDNAIAQDIAQEIQAALSAFDVSGAAFALVWPDGDYTAGFGVSDLTSRQPVTSDSRFAIASAIKPAVAHWMDERVQSRLIRWEMPLSEVWPSLDLGDAGQVTLGQAVGQTSGYPREDWAWIGRDMDAADLAGLVRQSVPIAPAGRLFTYHNVLFALALRGVESYTGQMFPLSPPDVIGYDRTMDGRRISLPETAHQRGVMSVVLDAGLSAAESVGVMRELLADDTIFTAETVNAAGASCCPLGSDIRYGRGMFVEHYAGVTLWLHDGDGLGFTAAMMLDPSSGMGMFIAVNQGGADAFVHAMRYAALERIYGLSASGAVAMRGRWTRETASQRDLAQRSIAPVRSDNAFAGEYGSQVRVKWDAEDGLTLYRGVFAWRLRSFAPQYALFDHGPLIGQPVDFICVDGMRRIVSGSTVLAEGGLCR